jgi:hypothetical protein
VNSRTITCPLCCSSGTTHFARDAARDYTQCGACSLVFVPPAWHLALADEKARYDLHRNSPDDAGYRRFLNRVFLPLRERLAPGNRGLDFGSGPSPTLSRMFRDAGYPMAIYDRFYEPAPERLEERYDFITATEVVEHLREPMKDLDRLWNCLEPGGWLAIMTRPPVDREAFPAWHYKNDRTHICFFPRETLSWLARKWNAGLLFIDKDVVLFHKRRSACPDRTV